MSDLAVGLIRMQDTWTHPTLGTFDHEDIWWRKGIVLPSLASFSYIDAAVAAHRSTKTEFQLMFECDEEEDFPNNTMIELATCVCENEAELISALLVAIWDDLNGRGPNSGMWWHGDLPNAYRGAPYASAACEFLAENSLPIPKSRGELKRILEPVELLIRRDHLLADEWIAELNFHAGFDIEHGVGVLTNGHSVLGIGHSAQACRYKS